MSEPLTMRFAINGSDSLSAAQVTEKMKESVLSVKRHGEVYEVTFEPAGDDEADSIWLMICEIGVHFPGAVLVD